MIFKNDDDTDMTAVMVMSVHCTVHCTVLYILYDDGDDVEEDDEKVPR